MLMNFDGIDMAEISFDSLKHRDKLSHWIICVQRTHRPEINMKHTLAMDFIEDMLSEFNSFHKRISHASAHKIIQYYTFDTKTTHLFEKL